MALEETIWDKSGSPVDWAGSSPATFLALFPQGYRAAPRTFLLSTHCQNRDLFAAKSLKTFTSVIM